MSDMVLDEKLLAPYIYITELSGKQIRSKLALAFNYWLHIPKAKVEGIMHTIQMLHNSSLLIDDIQDGSKLRRGQPVAHSIYGSPLTINAANFVYFLALEKVITLGHPQAINIYTEEMLELHRGQGMDIFWRDSYICPTEEQYFIMVKKKTGGLFRLAFKLMQLFSENKSNFIPLLNDLALYFQIRDDYSNLISPEYHTNKSFCEDLTEGKYSFPIIHGLSHDPCNLDRIKNIIKQRTSAIEVKEYCVDLLKKSGSFLHTLRTLQGLEKSIRNWIEDFGGNEYLTAIVEKLHIKEEESE